MIEVNMSRKKKEKEPEEPKKRSYNEKSRENLKQYGAGEKKIKEYEKKFEMFVKEHSIPLTIASLRDIIPYGEVFKSKEQGQFFNNLMIHLSDYSDEENLTMQDLADVVSMCHNTILKYRLLKESKNGDADDVRDSYKAIEAIDKTNEKLKTSLGANRGARIDPRARKDLTVIDLINQYDSKKERARIEKRIQEDIEEENSVEGIATDISDMIT
jgi:hypothetical protein